MSIWISVQLDQPFNPAWIDEQMALQGFPIDNDIYLGVTDSNTLLEVFLHDDATQQQQDNALATITAIAGDPNRNDQTEGQQEQLTQARATEAIADLNAKIPAAQALLAQFNDPGFDGLGNPEKIALFKQLAILVLTDLAQPKTNGNMGLMQLVRAIIRYVT